MKEDEPEQSRPRGAGERARPESGTAGSDARPNDSARPAKSFATLEELIPFANSTGGRRDMKYTATHVYGCEGYPAPWNGGRAAVLRFTHPTKKREKSGKLVKLVTQAHRGDDDRWRLGLPSSDPAKSDRGRPLYRIAEVREKCEAGARAVLVLEGEAAVDAAWSIGVSATCSLGGASAPSLSDWSAIADSKLSVAIAGSDDDAGREYESAVAQLLREVGQSPRILQLPGLRPGSGDDFAEFLTNQRAAGVADNAIASTVLGMAESAAEWVPPIEPRSKAEKSGKSTKPPTLAELAIEECSLFHDGAGEGYASFVVAGHREFWPVRSRAFRQWLGRIAFSAHISGSRTAADAAVDQLVANAIYSPDSPKLPIASRIGWHGGAIYVDLADDQWRCIAITSDGWSVIPSSDAPVRLIRTASMLPLPEPARGGSLNELLRFVNVAAGEDFVRVRGWLIGAFMPPPGTYPLLALAAERGSGKSFLAKLLAALVDPRKAQLMSPPRDLHDLDIAAATRRVVAIDNVSTIAAPLSDRLCTTLTGGGWVARELYSDLGEIARDVHATAIVTSIGPVVIRDDLTERTLSVECPPIAPDQRRGEREIAVEWRDALPRVLGALYEAVACALRNWSSVTLSTRPRLADHAQWVEAAGPALGAEPGSYVATVLRGQARADAGSLADDPVGAALLAFADREPGVNWSGDFAGFERVLLSGSLAPNDWPRSAQGMSARLARLRPALRRVGILAWVGDPAGHSRARQWFVRTPERSSASAASPAAEIGDAELLAEPEGWIGTNDADEADDAAGDSPHEDFDSEGANEGRSEPEE